jgi:hypothetical protein
MRPGKVRTLSPAVRRLLGSRDVAGVAARRRPLSMTNEKETHGPTRPVDGLIESDRRTVARFPPRFRVVLLSLRGGAGGG